MQTNFSQSIRHNRGFTLLETLAYIIGMVALIIGIVGLLTALYGWYSSATVTPHVDRVGLAIADQLVRDLWTGQQINVGSTSLNVASGSISMVAVTSTSTGTTTTRYIYLSGGRIIDQENNGPIQYLSPSDVSVTRFYLNEIQTSAPSFAIRFAMDITYSIKNVSYTRTYTGLGILKNSYQ